jgi:hypothetical protein
VYRAIAGLLLVAGATVAPAQEAVSLDVEIAAPADQRTAGPLVRSRGVLADSQLRERLSNGFPARLHYRAELWAIRKWFNDLESTHDWDVVVSYDPLDKTYAVVRIVADQVSVLGRFDRIGDAQSAVEQGRRIPLVPRRADRYYYIVKLDVETLSVSDLNEVEHWLRGDANPAVHGEKNPGTALGRGLRTLALKLIGGEKRQYQRRSLTFSPP